MPDAIPTEGLGGTGEFIGIGRRSRTGRFDGDHLADPQAGSWSRSRRYFDPRDVHRPEWLHAAPVVN
jgi:hypothetical protein